MMSEKPNLQDRGSWTSASAAHADSLCPGRHLAQRDIASVSTADAAHGTRIHAALAKDDPTGLNVEEADIYESCLSIWKTLVKDMEIVGGTAKEFREIRYWVKLQPEGFSHSGQLDRVARVGPRALIAEFKTLAGDIPTASRNLQLRDQVVLAAGNLLVNEVGAVVIQPLVTHKPEVCVYTQADIAKAQTEMFARIRASNDPNAKRVADEVQCKFCRAKNQCLEYQQWAGSTVPSMTSLLDVPMSAWSEKQKAFFLERRSIAQKWLDDCMDAIKAELIGNPNAVPGWMLKPGNKRISITDPQKLYDRFSETGGTLEQYMKCLTVVQTPFKETVSKLTGLRGQSLQEKCEELFRGITKETRNSPSVVSV